MGACAGLMELSTAAQRQNSQERNQAGIAGKCVDYMHKHYMEKISLSDLAAYVHLHPNYLCAVFKNNTGQTVLEYLNRLRAERARTLLSRPELTISQVAEQSGFQSMSTFQRTFKSCFGITASAYAKVNRRTPNL